jgi:hypothetical protein
MVVYGSERQGPGLVDCPARRRLNQAWRCCLDADSYRAGCASDSKRRASTLSMRPYSFASSAVMK